ncbi:MAG: KH domain-containing protein [Bacteroidota bacterium]
MREFLEYVAKQLVDNPDSVQITEEEKDNKVIFKIKVAQVDIGKIIGKQGRTAQSMRVLLSAVAAKSGKRAILEVED